MALANDLAGRGAVVTQMHTRDKRDGFHEMEGGSTATITGLQDADFLVTSDGVKHEVQE